MDEGMTVYTTSIRAMVYLEGVLRPIRMSVRFGIDYDHPDPYAHAVSHERMEFMMKEIFHGSIIISREDEMCEVMYDVCENQIVECWDTPWDQNIAVMLYLKMSAVLDNKIFLTFISFTCDLVEGLEYTFTGEEVYEGFPKDGTDWAKKLAPVGFDKPWYTRCDMTTGDYIQELVGDEELVEDTPHIANMLITWELVGLGWEKPLELEEELSTNKKKKSNITPFKPKVIK